MNGGNRLHPQPPVLATPDLAQLPRARLEAMRAAGAEVRECLRVLDKGGVDLVSEVLRAQGKFYELEHYPPDDVFDRDTHAQYYYHAHRGAGEHGHFHTFLRAPGIPEGLAPIPYAGEEAWPEGADSISHLIAPRDQLSQQASDGKLLLVDARPAAFFHGETRDRWSIGRKARSHCRWTMCRTGPNSCGSTPDSGWRKPSDGPGAPRSSDSHIG